MINLNNTLEFVRIFALIACVVVLVFGFKTDAQLQSIKSIVTNKLWLITLLVGLVTVIIDKIGLQLPSFDYIGAEHNIAGLDWLLSAIPALILGNIILFIYKYKHRDDKALNNKEE